ncbi:ABC transporter ATP-binding protein [Aquamicrobium sp. LC103]|uniref:ABC transporter ATP-binding protein n=1 Tax=Aquamicrobium sp. LC103 TaxID=1120658 RepID=UPI00063ECA94|nr:ABC transporter ATP-binding protein [Aquamicrobium sp. LC103]TKT78156.1 ABC transporter ATP-binding protein [Aquamicrobium sp. LC103]
MLQHERQGPASLSATGVAIGYGRTRVVGALDLTIEPAAFTVLVGPNGSGKSTILRALAGLLPVEAGTIELNGQSIARLSIKQLARHVGVLAQNPRAPEGLTVAELVQQGRYAHRSLFGRWSEADQVACTEALELTHMGEFAGRPLDSLSGGQRQRAWIAMTLAQQTEILLLDEPTTFLDLGHQIEVLDLVVKLVRERRKTIVAVLHDLNQAARYADRLVLLKEGSIVSEGTSHDVMSREHIRDVFGVDASIIPDPYTGAPMCIPALGTRVCPDNG